MPCRLSQRVSSFHSEPSRAVEEPKGMKIEKLFRVEDGLMDFFPFPGRRTCVSLCFFARRTFWGGETSIRPRSHNELTKTIYIYIYQNRRKRMAAWYRLVGWFYYEVFNGFHGRLPVVRISVSV